MPFGFVLCKYGLDGEIKCVITLLQTVCQILVDGRFGDSKMLCGGADGCALLNDVGRQVASALFDVLSHVPTPFQRISTQASFAGRVAQGA